MTCHVSVMPAEVISNLQSATGGAFLDCTFGGGGHSRQILDQNPENSVFAIDRDLDALARAETWSSKYSGRLVITHCSFKGLALLTDGKKFNGVLADLGTSVDQLESDRGFSFRRPAALDMRMDQTQELTAEKIVNEYSEHEIYVLLRKGGVGNEARLIARAIVKNRPIRDTAQLAELIAGSIKHTQKEQGKNRHPATLAFQALRIAVNDELSEIEALLDLIPNIVKSKARAVIISFHSLEDKLVAGRMRSWENTDSTPALWAGPVKSKGSLGKLLTRKAATPGTTELESNPKSRSARMRVFEFN